MKFYFPEIPILNIFFATVLGGLVFSIPASASSYTFHDIGTLGGQGTYAAALNATGQVTGNSITANSEDHAFITKANGLGIADLSTLPGGSKSLGFGISANGQAVGDSEIATPGFIMQTQAYVSDVNGGISQISNKWLDSHGRGINDAGQVVGNTGSGVFVTGPNGAGAFPIANLESYGNTAVDINNAGQITGYAYFSYNAHAYITSSNYTFVGDLGTLGGRTSSASALNDSGKVVGTSETATLAAHAFITDMNSNMTDLGTLGGQNSGAYDINSTGEVVGWANTTVGSTMHAFVTGPNGTGMTDLNSLVKLGNGAFLVSANGINDRGQIITNASDGHAYLLSPIPEPETYAMFLAGLGLLGWRMRSARS